MDGSGFNGREARYCVLFEDGKKIVERTNNRETNNTMEYMALLAALRECNVHDVIYTDSQLVFGQLEAGWQINYDHLKRLNELAKDLMQIKRAELVWIPREKNRAGKILERGVVNGNCRKHAEEERKA